MCYIFQVIIFLGVFTTVYSGIFDRSNGKKIDDALIKELKSKNAIEKCTIDVKSCVPHEGSRVDGTCNNYKYPSRGSARGPYMRLLKLHNDTKSDILKGTSGTPLPSARLVRTVIQSTGRVDGEHYLNAAAVHFLEFIRKDVSAMNGPLDFLKERKHCCGSKGKSDPRCLPIAVPEDDPYLKVTDIRCLNFSRAETFQDSACGGTTLEQINYQTPVLDLSTIYGVDDNALNTVREYKDGLLKLEKRNGRYVPSDLSRINNVNTITNTNASLENKCAEDAKKKGFCKENEVNATILYRFGFPEISNIDLRTTTLAIFFMREHNRIAKILHELNPCWKDDRLFKVARQINIATVSNIFMYELLPNLIGFNNMVAYRLLSTQVEHITAYDEEIVPLLYAEFDIAIRYFRTLMDGRIKRYDENYQYLGELSISETLFKQGLIEQGKLFEEINRGSFYQNAAKNDDIQDPEISEHFYGKLQRTHDLPASNVQRARDLRIGSYNDYRHLCGLKRAEKFEDFLDVIGVEKMLSLKNLYKDVNDVELLPGIMSENFIKGTYVGTTLFCIMVKQLQILRYADRFWYERGDQYHSLSLGQLQEMRRANIARLACDNAEGIEYIQPQAFLTVTQGNMHVPCTHIPGPDLRKWYDSRCLKQEDPGKGKNNSTRTNKELKNQPSKNMLMDYTRFFDTYLRL